MPDEIAVATFNIRNGLALDGSNSWPFRRRATASTIRSLDADVVGLQEVHGFQWRYLRPRLGHYGAVGRGRRDGRGGEHCLVLVRDPVEVIADTTRWFGEDPDRPGMRLPGASFPRIATIAECRHTSSDRRFDVVNVHLDEHLAGNRASSVAMLVRWQDRSRPTILLGDFNTTEDDAAVMAPLRDAGFEFVPLDRGTNHDFTGTTDGLRLDHILTRSAPSGRWEVLSSEVRTQRVGGRLPSDHWPAVARLRLHGD